MAGVERSKVARTDFAFQWFTIFFGYFTIVTSSLVVIFATAVMGGWAYWLNIPGIYSLLNISAQLLWLGALGVATGVIELVGVGSCRDHCGCACCECCKETPGRWDRWLLGAAVGLRLAMIGLLANSTATCIYERTRTITIMSTPWPPSPPPRPPWPPVPPRYPLSPHYPGYSTPDDEWEPGSGPAPPPPYPPDPPHYPRVTALDPHDVSHPGGLYVVAAILLLQAVASCVVDAALVKTGARAPGVAATA